MNLMAKQCMVRFSASNAFLTKKKSVIGQYSKLVINRYFWNIIFHNLGHSIICKQSFFIAMYKLAVKAKRGFHDRSNWYWLMQNLFVRKTLRGRLPCYWDHIVILFHMKIMCNILFLIIQYNYIHFSMFFTLYTVKHCQL